ncbi:uncharacterized protein [Antedon mediterranea]|uniref:uncharacterized protein n=1 Tax=Antedon mediterranea TaxID=105859 RepID=UPI003AF604A5
MYSSGKLHKDLETIVDQFQKQEFVGVIIHYKDYKAAVTKLEEIEKLDQAKMASEECPTTYIKEPGISETENSEDSIGSNEQGSEAASEGSCYMLSVMDQSVGSKSEDAAISVTDLKSVESKSGEFLYADQTSCVCNAGGN